MKSILQTSFIFVSVLLLSFQAQAYITKSGNVSGETWTNNNTYYVDGNLFVDDGTTLTIEAGTVVKFAVGQYLRVYGTLIAVGNSSANTYFTSMHDNSVGETILGSTGIPMAGGWAGIEINGTNDNDGIVQMNYCVVNYAGTTIYDGAVRLLRPDAGYVSNCDIGHSETNGIYVNLSNIYISNNYIHDNGGSGVNAYGDLAPTLTNNNFVNNGFFAAYINCNQLLNHTGNYGSGNAINAFGLRGEIDTDMTLSASVIGFPVSLINDLSILEGVTVTVPPGEVIKSGHFTIYVYGHLIADGESGNEIVFTSYKDDTYGGDLNGDGSATTPAPGDWEGIQVLGSTNGSIVMDHCIVRYGGEYNNNALSIAETDPTTISYSTIEYSRGDAISNYETELTVDHCILNNNFDHGVYANGGETILTNNQMNNNGGYPAYLYNTSISTYSGNSGSGNGIDAFALRGNVSQDLTLSAAVCGFPFVLTGQTYIDEGITLTLTAGDIYKMILGTRIYVYGSLIAKGTPGNEIVFTSIKDDTYGGDLNNDGNATIPEPQDWSGIDVSAATGIFEYCIIRYGGNNGENVNFYQSDSAVFNYSVSEYSYNNGVKTAYCNATIENSTISNNGDNGIYSNQGKITINNCVLNNNGEYAAYLSNVDLIEYSGNSGSGNGFDAFNISGNIHQDMTMSSAVCGFPFVVKSDINVDAGSTLTIAAGDIIKFEYGGFNVYGTLIAEGSPGNEIIFTSFKDDANGGDLNADGSATTPNKADWDGINLNGNNTAEGIGKFNYTRLLYGGNSDANVYFYRSDTGYFKNSYCGYSYYHGLKADYVNIAIENSSFENNNNYAAYLRYMTIQNYPGNSASGNGVDVFGVKGNVSSDLTWTESVSSVILCLVDDVTVDDNVTLTFNPGTIIKADYGQFNVYGTLDVNGTESDPVVFTSIEDDSWGGDSNNDADATTPNNGDWNGIYLNGSNANEGIGYFDHCRIRYGGYTGGSADANLYFYYSDTGYFKNSYSEYSYDDGLRADYTDIAIENSSFENNANYAAYMGYMTLRNYPGNSASGNGVDAFGVHGNISSDLTWTQTSSSVILCLLNDVTVDDDITLTLTEGTVIKADYGQFNVYGTLDVNGTESNPVVFTSIEDDSWGGDSNNDADATSPNNGDWNGIYLNGSNANEGIGYFDHCRIRYGGYTGGSADANLYFYHSDTGYFKNSFSEYSYDDGLRADYVDIAIENSSFENNANYAAYMGYITIRNYPGNSASGNGVDVFGVHGNVSSDITWTETASSVIISLLNDVSVDDNVTLTLTEGTIIKADYGQFNVYGTLDVNGTESNPVVFTSLEDDSWGGDSNNDADATAPAPGNWQGIYLNGNNDNEGTGLFDHCRIRYGGYTAGQADANLYFYHSDTGYFKNSYSEYSYDDGLRADYVDIAIENSSFENNTDYAANMGYMTLRNYPGNSASGNGKDVFGVYGNVSSDLTWTETSSSVILCLTNDVTVDDDVVLTLTEGTIIKADYGQFNVFGTLDVNGTESNPVVFTSLEDDSWGGDSNNDADATVPAPGNWQGIYLNGNNDYEGAGYFDHCRIMYGGYSAGQADANLCFYFSDDGYFKNSICEYSGMTGLRTSYAAPQIRESVFSDNSQYAIYAEGDTVPDLGGNSLTNAGLNVFINNYSGGIQLYNETSHEMNAFYNDWGYYTEAEIDAHIYDDEEYSNYGEVLFNPWYDPANPPLIANFGADTLFGEAPLTVQFTDSTLLNPTGWEWDFENDGTVDSFDQNPEWTYTQPGTYSVKLSVSSGGSSDFIIKTDLITVQSSGPITIAEARQKPMGTVVTITGIITCGPEYGNLHFIQDATAGMALYSVDLNYFNMGDEVEVTGELYDYNGMMEMGTFTAHSVLSTGNPMPAAQTIAIGDLGEEYESEIVRIDNVTFADGGSQFAAYVNYYFSDVSGSTYTRLHDNTTLKNQVIPNYSVSYVGICAQYDAIPETPYSIYPRDYNDLVYTDIMGFERQSTGFSRRYSMVNSVCAVDENIVWATAQNEKDYPTLNEVTRTTDGGFTWETKQIPGTEGLVISSISAFDDNIAWVSAYQLFGTNQQGIYATADGGTTWTHQSTATFAPEDGGFPNFVHFWDPMNGICMGDPANGYFEIYTTESGGEFWTRVDQGSIPAPLADETGIVDRFAVSGDNVWFTTNKGRVFMSPNGGHTWMAQQTPITGACIVEFKNPAEGLLISNGNNEIYRTYDQGNTWQPVTFSGPLRSHDLKYVPGTNGIYVATEISGANAGISYTLDDGETWVAMDYTYGVHFGAMDWINTTTGFIGANNFDENEGGMWKYTGNDLVEYNISWSPQDPTWDDFITITVTGVTQGAWLHWGVNYWQTPDPAYWPPNTEPFPGGGTAVQTPMNGPNGNNELSIVLGPFNDPAQAISQVNFVIHYYDDSWDNNNGNDYHININTGPAQPTVDLKVMLEGPYNSDTKLMRTQLNDQGYLPLSQPYNPSLPYYNESSPVWWYEGTESVASIPNDVVDWVIVQFRDATSPDEATSATIIQEQAAFVLFSGQIVDLDGSSPLTLTETFSNNLYAVVLHRNHLGVISAIPLSETNGNYSFDFTTGAEQAYGGTNGHKLLSDGIWGMVSADGSGNGLIQNTDETAVWKADLGQSGYKGGDFDMNGLVQNTDETNYWKVNLGAGGQTPGKANQTGYQSQVPE